MFAQLNFFSLLILLGCLQAFVLSALLLVKPGRSAAHIFLALLLTVFSLNNLSAVFFDLGWSWKNPFLLLLPISFVLAVGPALFLYIRSTLTGSKVKAKDALHFIPAAIELIWYGGLSIYFGGDPEQILQFYRNYEAWYSLPEQAAGIISLLLYIIFSLQLLRKYATHIYAFRMKVAVYLLSLGWLGWTMLLIADVAFTDFTIGYSFYYPLYLLMSVTVYALGYMGYFISPALTKPKVVPPRLEALSKALQAAIEKEKWYLDPALRVKEVADRLGCTSTELSACLNQVLHTGFYDFVNQYRLAEVKRRLSDAANNELTVAGIAYDCGFRSKSTFNAFFRKQTGLTPKDFKQQAQKDVRWRQTDIS